MKKITSGVIAALLLLGISNEALGSGPPPPPGGDDGPPDPTRAAGYRPPPSSGGGAPVPPGGSGSAQSRSSLFDEIQNFGKTNLKKTETVDKSKPKVGGGTSAPGGSGSSGGSSSVSSQTNSSVQAPAPGGGVSMADIRNFRAKSSNLSMEQKIALQKQKRSNKNFKHMTFEELKAKRAKDKAAASGAGGAVKGVHQSGAAGLRRVALNSASQHVEKLVNYLNSRAGSGNAVAKKELMQLIFTGQFINKAGEVKTWGKGIRSSDGGKGDTAVLRNMALSLSRVGPNRGLGNVLGNLVSVNDLAKYLKPLKGQNQMGDIGHRHQAICLGIIAMKSKENNDALVALNLNELFEQEVIDLFNGYLKTMNSTDEGSIHHILTQLFTGGFGEQFANKKLEVYRNTLNPNANMSQLSTTSYVRHGEFKLYGGGLAGGAGADDLRTPVNALNTSELVTALAEIADRANAIMAKSAGSASKKSKKTVAAPQLAELSTKKGVSTVADLKALQQFATELKSYLDNNAEPLKTELKASGVLSDQKDGDEVLFDVEKARQSIDNILAKLKTYYPS